jgi:uncharacterized protein YutE (UPF0331/DUF86 family)
MTVDADLVTRKLMLILGDLDALRAIAAKGETAYAGDRIDQAVVERYLERAIGRMIDVNFHIITGAGHSPPTDYHASFLRLAEMGVLDPTFARQIARAAGLRNRLVHEYDEIDPRRVFEGLEAALRDVPVYASRVNAYLSASASSS